jgi:hypothetical protein
MTTPIPPTPPQKYLRLAQVYERLGLSCKSHRTTTDLRERTGLAPAATIPGGDRSYGVPLYDPADIPKAVEALAQRANARREASKRNAARARESRWGERDRPTVAAAPQPTPPPPAAAPVAEQLVRLDCAVISLQRQVYTVTTSVDSLRSGILALTHAADAQLTAQAGALNSLSIAVAQLAETIAAVKGDLQRGMALRLAGEGAAPGQTAPEASR